MLAGVGTALTVGKPVCDRLAKNSADVAYRDYHEIEMLKKRHNYSLLNKPEYDIAEFCKDVEQEAKPDAPIVAWHDVMPLACPVRINIPYALLREEKAVLLTKDGTLVKGKPYEDGENVAICVIFHPQGRTIKVEHMLPEKSAILISSIGNPYGKKPPPDINVSIAPFPLDIRFEGMAGGKNFTFNYDSGGKSSPWDEPEKSVGEDMCSRLQRLLEAARMGKDNEAAAIAGALERDYPAKVKSKSSEIGA